MSVINQLWQGENYNVKYYWGMGFLRDADEVIYDIKGKYD